MRYWKGSIVLSARQDLPLLQQVLRSGFVTYGQLYEFMKLEYSAVTRRSLWNRVQRLVNHNLVTRLDKSSMGDGPVYTIAEGGTAKLIGTGEFYCGPTIKPGGEPDWNALQHAIELNDIHLALKRNGLLKRWTYETEIRSRNELTTSGFLKDYDAVIVVSVGDKNLEIALEYERTPKAIKHYERIRGLMERESKISHFLYLVANPDLLLFVSEFFKQTKQAIAFGLCREFLRTQLATRVLLPRRGALVSLTEFLSTPSPLPQATRTHHLPGR